MSYLWFSVALALALVLVVLKRRSKTQIAAAVAEQEELREELNKTEQTHGREVRRLLDAFSDPFFSINEEGKVIRFNQAASEFFRSREILDRSFQQIFIDSALTSAIKSAIESAQPVSSIVRLPANSPFSANSLGKESVWEVDLRPLSIQRDRLEIQLMMRDITAGIHADQVRQDFVANASHELRTPLSIISGYLEILTEPGGLAEPEMAKKMLGTMDRHVDRINRIVEDMLVISKLESEDAAPLNMEPFGLKDCVQDVLERLELVIEKQKALIHLEMEPISITGDRFYWTQILFNLIENALKQNATLPVEVTVAAERVDGNCLQLTISDNGIGIPSADLPFIFKRFFRVEKHHAQNQVKGTGLGLSIVKRAIEAHGGEISATSIPGVETTFKIVVPLPS